MNANVVRLPLASVRLDEKCQPRVLTDLNLAKEYAEAIVDGAVFPPVVVFFDGTDYWLADGFHRWYAAEMASASDILADVREGDRRAAILHSVSANAEHGWRRSSEDKRRAVDALLEDPEWRQWSDREISRRCGVGHPLVAERRTVTGRIFQLDQQRSAPGTRTYINKHGNTSTMNTGGINAGRGDPDREYAIHDDPRQLDIKDQPGWKEAPAPFVFDDAAASIRLHVGDVVAKLADPEWPSPDVAMKAWMKGRGETLILEQIRSALRWLTEFAELFEEQEPHRLVLVENMLERVRRCVNGTH